MKIPILINFCRIVLKNGIDCPFYNLKWKRRPPPHGFFKGGQRPPCPHALDYNTEMDMSTETLISLYQIVSQYIM